MTYLGSEPSINAVFDELKKRAENEKIQTFAEYKGMVDEMVEEKASYGFFSQQEDIEQVKEVLESRWNEIESHLDHISKLLK